VPLALSAVPERRQIFWQASAGWRALTSGDLRGLATPVYGAASLDAGLSRFICVQAFQWVFFQNMLVLWLVQIAYKLSLSAANVAYSLTWQVR
jgi:hypothetical protein